MSSHYTFCPNPHPRMWGYTDCTDLTEDTGRSIYGFINPYRRGGLATGEYPNPQSYPFREGPDPEIHQGDNPEALAYLLAVMVRIYVQDLGCDSEAIGIL